MANQYFTNLWTFRLQDARKKALLWERRSLPPIPDDVNEETVVEHLRAIQPYVERANRFPYRLLNSTLSTLLSYTLGICIILVRVPKLLNRAYVYFVCTPKNAWVYLPVWLSLVYFYGVYAGLLYTLILIPSVIVLPLLFKDFLLDLMDHFDRWAQYLWRKRDAI